MPVQSSLEKQIGPISPWQAACQEIDGALVSIGVGTEQWDALPRAEKYDRLSVMIGKTPIERLPGIGNGIITKFELSSLSGSHYDRAYLHTLRSFEDEGLVRPGDELRDITSGSAGISLAVLGKALDYKVRVTVPDELPLKRVMPMRWFGADIAQSGSGYIKGASDFQAEEIKTLKSDPNWQLTRPSDRNQRAFIFSKDGRRICYLNHSENLLSPQAFQAIGHEAVTQLVEPPHSVLLAMGNWTTIAGISPVLRRAWPNTRLIGYEGINADVHDNYGTTVSGIPLRFRDDSLLDKQVVVTNEQRDHYDRVVNGQLPTREQVGHSTVMGIAAAVSPDIRNAPGKVLTMAYDHKLRY